MSKNYFTRAERLKHHVVDIKTGCHLWTRAKNNKGYGHFTENKKTISAPKAAYEERFGAVPEGLVIRHLCHNPACINVEHLITGTHKDNAKDKVEANRQYRPVGELNWSNKLSIEDVVLIQKLIENGLTNKAIAKTFNVHKNTISGIKQKRKWKHLA